MSPDYSHSIQGACREGEAPAEPRADAGNFGSAGASPSHGDSSSPKNLPKRKRPAHGVFPEANKPVIVFLTVNTKERGRWLATPECHALLRAVWTEAAAWLVGRYVIMPDHIHLFAAPGPLDVALDNWVMYWKGQFTQRNPRKDGHWQAGHWDRRLRSGESYAQKWAYVRDNPLRQGLVQRPEDWPFQGELNPLPW